jgi:hypothetical protein
MSLWRSRPNRTPVEVPRDVVIEVQPEAVALEQAARRREVLRLVRHALLTESLRGPLLRNGPLLSLCLDIRSALEPAPAAEADLREAPTVGIRCAVPVIPGRTS